MDGPAVIGEGKEEWRKGGVRWRRREGSGEKGIGGTEKGGGKEVRKEGGGGGGGREA